MSLQTLLRDRRGLVFAVPAGALAVLVVVAALNLDSGSTKQNRVSRIGDAEALLAPRTATTDELSRASNSVEDQASISLASGAWIQVADETGRLAQQYSATKLDPMPGSQLAMTEPRAMMYMKETCAQQRRQDRSGSRCRSRHPCGGDHRGASAV